MFREMRKTKQRLSLEECEKVLRKQQGVYYPSMEMTVILTAFPSIFTMTKRIKGFLFMVANMDIR